MPPISTLNKMMGLSIMQSEFKRPIYIEDSQVLDLVLPPNAENVVDATYNIPCSATAHKW